MKRLVVAVLIAGAMVVPTAAPASAACEPASVPSYASWLLTKVNEHRKVMGKRQLTPDPGLAQVANTWSRHMATGRSVLAHNLTLFTPLWHARLRITSFGENVGFGQSLKSINKALWNSHLHHVNRDNGAWYVAGFSVWRDCVGGIWVTEDYGTARY